MLKVSLMIEWFSFAQLGFALVVGVLCLIYGLLGRPPQDLTVGLVAGVCLLLLIQLVLALLAPAMGNQIRGDLLEFYVYLVSAILLPVLAIFWALLERTRWSTVILGVVCLALAVMIYRMNQIWFAFTV